MQDVGKPLRPDALPGHPDPRLRHWKNEPRNFFPESFAPTITTSSPGRTAWRTHYAGSLRNAEAEVSRGLSFRTRVRPPSPVPPPSPPDLSQVGLLMNDFAPIVQDGNQIGMRVLTPDILPVIHPEGARRVHGRRPPFPSGRQWSSPSRWLARYSASTAGVSRSGSCSQEKNPTEGRIASGSAASIRFRSRTKPGRRIRNG